MRSNRNTKSTEDEINVFSYIFSISTFTRPKPNILDFVFFFFFFFFFFYEPIDLDEIKKFIGKANNEIINFHRNHKVMNELCDQVFKHITDLSHSKEYIEYESFFDKLSQLIYQICSKNRYNKDFHNG